MVFRQQIEVDHSENEAVERRLPMKEVESALVSTVLGVSPGRRASGSVLRRPSVSNKAKSDCSVPVRAYRRTRYGAVANEGRCAKQTRFGVCFGLVRGPRMPNKANWPLPNASMHFALPRFHRASGYAEQSQLAAVQRVYARTHPARSRSCQTNPIQFVVCP